MPDRYLGQVIGKYRVTRHLATGSWSWVYEAVDQDLEIPVALKILRPEFSGVGTAKTRFRREAAMAARLRHPHIVTVRDVGQADGTMFVAMDLYPLTLGRRLALIGHLPESEVVKLGIGVAAALAAAHAQHIVHRDIKPDNILLDAAGNAVLADFGLARALATPATPGDTSQVEGTPHYFSPEQARGQELDARTDLYSLGATLYRAATGRLLFEGDDWHALATQHIGAVPTPPRTLRPELTRDFEAILLRLLAKEPAARFATAMHVADALAALPTAPSHLAPAPRANTNANATQAVDTARPPAPRRLPRLTTPILVGALVIWTVWFGLKRRGSIRPPDGPTATVSADSSLGLTADRAPEPTGPLATDKPPGARGNGMRRSRGAAGLPLRLTVSTADSGNIYVDDRAVGTGKWTGDVALAETAPTALTIRVVLAEAPTACQTARRDTVLTGLTPGQRLELRLPVRGCTVVRLRIEPRDARVQFVSLDGLPDTETRADSVDSYSLPWGRYLLRISAPYCIPFADTLVVGRGESERPVSLRLVCS